MLTENTHELIHTNYSSPTYFAYKIHNLWFYRILIMEQDISKD